MKPVETNINENSIKFINSELCHPSRGHGNKNIYNNESFSLQNDSKYDECPCHMQKIFIPPYIIVFPWGQNKNTKPTQMKIPISALVMSYANQNLPITIHTNYIVPLRILMLTYLYKR